MGIASFSDGFKLPVWAIMVFVLAASSVQGKEERAPLAVDGTTTISTEEAHALFLAGTPFVDVRNPRLFARRHVTNAHHLELKHDFTKAALEKVVAKDEPVVIYCSGVKCLRSSTACEFAVDWGFTNVKYYREGIVGWRDAGLPMVEAE